MSLDPSGWPDVLGPSASNVIPFHDNKGLHESLLHPANNEPIPDQRPRTVSLKQASGMSSRRMRFLWEDIFPMSCATLIGGTGGVGKSTFLLWLAGRVTRGDLEGDVHGKPAAVLYVSHEDSMEEVVLNRLDANGVDRERFFQLSIHSKQVRGDVLPNLPDDMPLIREAVEMTGAKMLIIDPVTSTMGGDNDKLHDVRAVIDPLNALAAELGLAIFCITHFRKGGGKSEDLISGSRAYWDATRCVALFAKDEDTGDTIMSIVKGNALDGMGSYYYHLSSVEVMTDEGTTARVGKVAWQGPTDRTVSGVVNTDPTEVMKQGQLANEILEFLTASAGQAVTTAQVEREFKHAKPETVRQNLSRLAKRGQIQKPYYGVWMVPVDVTPRAGGITDVTPVTHMTTAQTGVTGATGVAPPTRGVTPGLCNSCGYPMAASLIARGETVHPTCD